MRWVLRILAAAFVLAAGMGQAQPAPKRLALIIGNGAYSTPGWALANPPRDARLIAERLRALGFETDLVIDANRAQMEAAMDGFGGKLKRAGPDAVTFFFYAGHGAQKDGANYLVPVDANAQTMDRLRFQSPPMQFLLDDMIEVGNAVNVIVLDACRNLPLPEGVRSIGGEGLADIGKPQNFFIAYATSPGRVARDGAGQNSPFTTALAAALQRQADEPIELMFSDINASVYNSTRGGQAPEYRNGLVRAPRWRLGSASHTLASDGRPAFQTAVPFSTGFIRPGETLEVSIQRQQGDGDNLPCVFVRLEPSGVGFDEIVLKSAAPLQLDVGRVGAQGFETLGADRIASGSETRLRGSRQSSAATHVRVCALDRRGLATATLTHAFSHEVVVAPGAARNSPPPPSATRPAAAAEDVAWLRAVTANTVAAFEDYLRQYPQGRFRVQAQQNIARVRTPVSAPAVTVPPAMATRPAPTTATAGTSSAASAPDANKAVPADADGTRIEGTDTADSGSRAASLPPLANRPPAVIAALEDDARATGIEGSWRPIGGLSCRELAMNNQFGGPHLVRVQIEEGAIRLKSGPGQFIGRGQPVWGVPLIERVNGSSVFTQTAMTAVTGSIATPMMIKEEWLVTRSRLTRRLVGEGSETVYQRC